MKRRLLYILCTICLFLIFQMPATAEEIAGFPVIEETGHEAGISNDWKILPKEAKETGFIEGFAFDGGHRCAIRVDNKIIVYDETICIFNCQFKTEGSCRLSFWNGDLIVYSTRGEHFFKFDLETSELKEYRLDESRVDGYKVSEALELNPEDPNTDNGFYVANHLGNRNFTIGYDMLIYVKDGRAQTVYSSYTKVVAWKFAVVVNFVVLLFLFWLEKRNWRIK